MINSESLYGCHWFITRIVFITLTSQLANVWSQNSDFKIWHAKKKKKKKLALKTKPVLKKETLSLKHLY